MRSRCGQGSAHSRGPCGYVRCPMACENSATRVQVPAVSQPSKPRRPGPPHNPGVRELVANKVIQRIGLGEARDSMTCMDDYIFDGQRLCRRPAAALPYVGMLQIIFPPAI